ncbi:MULTISPECIES: energy-coupling factor ABC transporter permease [unclassified Paenibacillus]|uniref:energy-coupling factor ABC transporter permease n=1 Tax=unclassified Paenibacillus TaxID=185978 RepID=UPI001AE1B94C|nr:MULTISPECIES: energy-coupling factor ABC transporter permease [unclassified Paenibacillus]MBP1154294.1 cobalt/nickel transport system permease protein [Paenibacillus sp. PvP091]MBP1170321.1 cobalt/nickel transport system permease protein [Paenibacillus sp. PvR098]MBP2441349.1 cobalt/nickel transport system permease protein [Paenibacillus sp. PvP052]
MISKKAISTLLLVLGFTLYLTVNEPQSAYAMHIMEGFLPLGWAIFWWAVFVPFFILGLRALIKITRETPELKIMLGVAGAFILVLSALKIPSVTGSSSHPTGTGLGAIMFGPLPMSVLGSIVLLFQALLLAHGGLTTLGANAFSMAVAGPMIGYAAYRGMMRSTGKQTLSIFTAAALANLSTYVVTSIQLSLAFPAESGGFLASLAKFGGIFAITQVPLAISEGLLTVLIWNWLKSNSSEEMSLLQSKMKGA